MKFLQALCNVILFILFTVCFCMTGYVYAVKFVNEYFNRNEVVVPDITSLKYSLAEKLIPEQYHLKIKKTASEFNKTIPADSIIRQDPPPNMSVKPGKIIEVIVSKGIKTVECVNVIGLDLRKAQLTLKNCNFSAGIRTYIHHDTAKYGTILAQSPKPLSKVEEFTNVNLLISKGPAIHNFIMPDLIGYNFQEIKLLIKKMGLLIGKISYEDLNDRSPGSILKQEPNAGEFVKENSLVDLVVNIEDKDITSNTQRKFETIAFELPESKNEIFLKMILSDNKGVREIYRKKHAGNEKIEHIVGYFGKARITIYIDEKKYTVLEYN